MQALMFHTSKSFGWLSSLHDPGCPSLLPIEEGFRSAKSSNVSMKQLLDDKLEGKVAVRLLFACTQGTASPCFRKTVDATQMRALDGPHLEGIARV